MSGVPSTDSRMPPSLDPALRETKAAAARTVSKPTFGDLPEWDLSDLYPGMDSPAFAQDLARAEAECKAFAETYRGKLDGLARDAIAAEALGAAVARYEAVEDLLGRI